MSLFLYLQIRFSIKLVKGLLVRFWNAGIEKPREMVAIKVVRSVKKYREAAMLEVDVLQLLGKYDRNGSR